MAPSGGRQIGEILEKRRRAAAQGDEGNAQLIQARQMGVGAQARIEHQVAGQFAVLALPELAANTPVVRA